MAAPTSAAAAAARPPGRSRFAITRAPPPTAAPPPEQKQRPVTARQIVQEREAQLQAARALFPRVYVKAAEYSFMSAADVKAASVCVVESPELAGPGTLGDPRMGPSRPDQICQTCSGGEQCPGHYGRIELEVHRINRAVLESGDLIRILASVSNETGELLVSRQDLDARPQFKRLRGPARLRYVYQLSLKQREVPGQRKRNPYFQLDQSKKSLKVAYRTENNSKSPTHYMSTEEVSIILNGIRDEDIPYLGFTMGSHPKNIIMSNLIVLPPRDRPNRVQRGRSTPDDLTNHYMAIIRENNDIRKLLASSRAARIASVPSSSRGKAVPMGNELELNRLIARLDQRIDYLFGMDSYKESGAARREVSSIKKSFTGKKGMGRGEMMGKRGDFAARSVAGPDPTLRLGQVGVPDDWADILTTETVVTIFNRLALQKDLERGHIKSYTKATGPTAGQLHLLRPGTRLPQLQVGDKVEVRLKTGDWVLINRAPTLHKENIRAFQVVLRPYNTLRVHISDVAWFNLDFDGDEINLLKPRTQETAAEAALLMNTAECIINPQRSTPGIGAHYDTITQLAELTDDEAQLPMNAFTVGDWSTLIQTVTDQSHLATLRARLKRYGIPVTSGRALFSALLPSTFNYRNGAVEIVNGVLLRGKITAADIGRKSRSIIQMLWKDFGRDVTADFITDMTRMANAYSGIRPVTVGFLDCLPQNTLVAASHQRTVQAEMTRAQLWVDALGVPESDPEAAEGIESQITQRIGTTSELGKELSLQSLGPSNNFVRIVGGGAKGTAFNTGQIAGAVGQQYVRGQRIGVDPESGRCSVYFPPGSTAIGARGMCEQPFIRGLSPAFLLYHQWAGREGLIDTAVSTKTVGSAHRELTKGLEDITVSYTGTVINSQKEIIQFLYGGHGLDPVALLAAPDWRGGSTVVPFDILQMAENANRAVGY